MDTFSGVHAGEQSASKLKKKNSQMSWSSFAQHISIKSIIKTLAILAMFISIPMEYIRMYQEQVATKVAHMKDVSRKRVVFSFIQELRSFVHDFCPISISNPNFLFPKKSTKQPLASEPIFHFIL